MVKTIIEVLEAVLGALTCACILFAVSTWF
jgi:hypothetical protein